MKNKCHYGYYIGNFAVKVSSNGIQAALYVWVRVCVVNFSATVTLSGQGLKELRHCGPTSVRICVGKIHTNAIRSAVTASCFRHHRQQQHSNCSTIKCIASFERWHVIVRAYCILFTVMLEIWRLQGNIRRTNRQTDTRTARMTNGNAMYFNGKYQPRTSTVTGIRSFSSAASNVWNPLPLSIRTSTLIPVFKVTQNLSNSPQPFHKSSPVPLAPVRISVSCLPWFWRVIPF